MRNAQRFLAAVENQRHDQILLVVEVTDEPFKQNSARIGIVVTAPAHRITATLQRVQQRIRGLGGARHVGMDMVVVALQNIEPSREPLVSRAEDREIMQVLDLMVDVELIEHKLQPRHELTRKLLRRKLAGTEKRGNLLDSS